MKTLKESIVKYQGHLFPVLDALINGLNLMVHIYISWMITKNEYGVLGAVLSFITLVMVTGVSIQTFVAKALADPKWNDRQFYSLKRYCQSIIFKILVVLVMGLPFIKQWLRVDYGILFLVLIIFISNSVLSIYRGVYQGKRLFLKLSKSFYIEALIKLMSIVLLLFIYKNKVFAVIGVLLGMLVALYVDHHEISFLMKTKDDIVDIDKAFQPVFSANFFYFYLTTTTLIMTNYFLPNTSGVFAVSIKYSQIYMHIGFSIITVLIPILSQFKYDIKKFKRWVNGIFALCFIGGSLALVLYKTLFPQTITWLFGATYIEAEQLIFLQAISYFAFVIASYFVTMNIILDRKSYLKYLMLASAGLTVGIVSSHETILQIIYIEMITFVGLALFVMIDFYMKEDIEMTTKRKLTLLFLSWRDIKAPKKGGAEVFTHEMLKRVDQGEFNIIHFSPMFDKSQKDEMIDGVRYIRKGNIFSVILHSMIYYFTHKNQIDYVIDQCNEHRFFTPFWLPRRKRIFFIHQMGRELWMRNLKAPFAQLGFYSENWMTRIYRKNMTFTVSPSTKQDLLDLGFSESRVRILPEGINFKPWTKDMFMDKEAEYTFTYVGRFARYKGIDAAVRAFGELKQDYPNARLWIVGKENEGFKNEVLMPIIDGYNLNIGEDIKFFGFVSEELKLELMSRSHSILYPSDREGWGLTVTEAAAVGTPSIVYNSPGLIDAVNKGQAGIIAPSNTALGLLGAMVNVIEDKGYYNQIKDKAHDFSQNFQWSITAETLETEMAVFEQEGLK